MLFILNTKGYNLGHSIIESKLHIFPIKFTKIKSECLLYRTATILESFEQHLMSYRGIHKHCDTCTQILEEGQVGWFSVPWHILAWIRRRISWGRKSRAEGSLRPSLPRSLLHLLIVGQRSSTKMRSLGSTTSTSEQRTPMRTTLRSSRGEAMWAWI